MSGGRTRSDHFGLGIRAFEVGSARSECPFPSTFFEGRRWLMGWDYGRSRSAAHDLAVELENVT